MVALLMWEFGNNAMNFQNLLSEVKSATESGCKIVSFCYRSKTSGETSLYKVILGVDLENAYKKDLEIAARIKVVTAAERKAREEIIKSLKDSLRLGIGRNPAYTQPDLYDEVVNGIRVNKKTRDLHLWGFVLTKVIMSEGKHKQYKSSDITIAKRAIKQKLKSDRFRDFVLVPECISGLKVRGHILEFHNEETYQIK
jgi:hypothetical protein